MKQKTIIFLGLILSLLVGCNPTPSTSESNSENTSLVNGSDSESNSSSIISSEEPSSELSPPISTTNPPPAESFMITLDEDTNINGLTYADGNYSTFYVMDTAFYAYRAAYQNKKRSHFLRLLPFPDYYRKLSLPGFVQNLEPLQDITYFSVTYTNENASSGGAKVWFGDSLQYNQGVVLPFSETKTTINIEVSGNPDYFKMETENATINIEAINIYYDGTYGEVDYVPTSVGDHHYRINPLTYTGPLYEGVSVTVPTKISEHNGTYTELETKEYTYYSSGYVLDNPELVEEASHVNPEDIATYFSVFGTWPANYGGFNDHRPTTAESFNKIENVFGDLARKIQFYDRNDGYALAVPFVAREDGNPVYYELDVAVNNSYVNGGQRGSGRVVVWVDGWDETKGATDYQGMTAIYTDDHYVTFAEYNNAGNFGLRFNGTAAITPYVWGPARTLSKA